MSKRKLIIVVSGKKDAGKTTLANQIAAHYLNLKRRNITDVDKQRWTVSSTGKLMFSTESDPVTKAWLHEPACVEHGIATEDTVKLGVRIIAFASPLKEIAIKVMGLQHESCYGTNDQKNDYTHIQWDGLPLRTRLKYRQRWWHEPRRGAMTGREVMQVLGTDIVRFWYDRAWAVAGYELASDIPEELVIINDSRFPNESDVGEEYRDSLMNREVKQVRMLRNVHPNDKHPSETAMDNYPLTMFDVVVEDNLSMQEQSQMIGDHLALWMVQLGIDPVTHEILPDAGNPGEPVQMREEPERIHRYADLEGDWSKGPFSADENYRNNVRHHGYDNGVAAMLDAFPSKATVDYPFIVNSDVAESLATQQRAALPKPSFWKRLGRWFPKCNLDSLKIG